MDKKISIVGIGMNGLETMTSSAIKAIENSDIIIGADRMVKQFEYLKKPCFISYISSEIADNIFECQYEKIAVLMSGDCGFYSGAEKLITLLEGYDAEIICGISSPIYFCSRLKMSWYDLHFVNLHGVSGNVVRNVCAHEKTFFLLGGNVTPGEICKRLCDYGLNCVEVYIGENLGYERERIISGRAEDFTDIETENLCVMIVKNTACEKYLRSGISDDEFIRGKVPMTKSEVRNVCISKLEIGHDSICWDIGSGTGSVSVEMAIRCTEGTVYSVDRNSDAVELTDKNRHLFGCDNIKIIHDAAENAVVYLPVPDCVFIGGSGGRLKKIITEAYNKNPGTRIILTAVSIETLNESMAVFESLGISAEITQIAVTRTKKAGSHTMLAAENPVFIIKGTLQ